jgi:ERAP1-like protein
MTSVLDQVGQSLVDDETRPAFRTFVASILLPMAKELGWDAKKNDTDDQKLMRRTVLGALAHMTDEPWMASEADKRATAWLKDPTSVDADVAAIALRVSSRRATSARLKELEAAMTHATSPQDRLVAAGALGAFTDPALLKQGLDLLLTDRVKVQDGFFIWSLANSWVETRPVTIAWVKERWPDLKKKIPSFLLARFAEAIASICDGATRADAAAFFSEGLKDIEGADRRLHQLLETADQCIDLRAREGGSAKKRLIGKKAEGK